MAVKECRSSLAHNRPNAGRRKRLPHTLAPCATVVGRALRAFDDDNLIRRERGRLVVVDRAGLEREAMING
jgi:hypothetical protein